MLSSKADTMKPLFESANGIHLTAYIRIGGDIWDLKSQIRSSVQLAESYLAPVMTPNEITQFLAPIRLLQEDGKRLKCFKGSIGLFRTEKFFRLLSLPIDVEPACIVADSFHIKPLLKWMQIDREFLLLGLESQSASLYQGNFYTLKHIDTVLFPEAFRWELIDEWIMSLTQATKPRLFIAGKKELTRPLLSKLQYENTASVPIWADFNDERSAEIASQIRSILRADAKKSFERALVEFHYAVDLNQAKGNIFAIARAAVQGKIRKLLIADGIQIFGKINRKNGALKLNGRDLDHEDDDILDDIAQAVLSNGGEVTLATRGEIPRGRPILAIMDDPSSVSKKLERYEERIAI